MTSVERVIEYTKIEPEAADHNDDYSPPKGWPVTGKLEFKDMCLAYGKDAPNVLKNIDLAIKDSEKVKHKICVQINNLLRKILK